MVARNKGTKQGEAGPGEDLAAAIREQHAATVALTRVYNKAIDVLLEMDALQQASLSVGITANSLRQKLGTNLKDLPGGMKAGMDHAVQFLQAGFKDVNGGMLKLVGAAKVTGQNVKLMIQGLASMASILPMSTQETGKLGTTILEFSLKYGTTTTAMIEALRSNIKAIKLVAAGDTEKGKKLAAAVVELTAQAPLFKDTINQLADQMSFEDGAASISDMLVRTNRLDLVQRAQAGENSASLLREIAKASVDQYDSMTRGTKDQQGHQMAVAKGIKLLPEMMSSYKAFELAMQEGLGPLAERNNQVLADQFSQSIGAITEELLGIVQVHLLPHLETLTTFLSEWSTALKKSKLLEFLVGWGAKVLLVLAAFKFIIFALGTALKLIIIPMAGPLTAILAVAWLLYEAFSFWSADDKKHKEEQKFEKKKEREIKKPPAPGSTLTEALLAARMAAEFQFFGKYDRTSKAGVEDTSEQQNRDSLRERIADAVTIVAEKAGTPVRSLTKGKTDQ